MKQFQELHEINLSEEERISGVATTEHIASAIAALHRDGIVVINNAVDLSHIEILNDKLCGDIGESLQNGEVHFNTSPSAGNISTPPPRTPGLIYEDVWANHVGVQILNGILGPGLQMHYANGNTALPGHSGGRQPVHADLTSPYAHFPFGYVINHYLVDTDETNGATEIWLGSHRDATYEDQEPHKGTVKLGLLARRREWAPPIRPAVVRGALVIRDLRLWHAGISNPSNTPRIMLAFCYFPWWYQCPLSVKMPLNVKNLVDNWKADVEIHADYLDEKRFEVEQAVFDNRFFSENHGLDEFINPA